MVVVCVRILILAPSDERTALRDRYSPAKHHRSVIGALDYTGSRVRVTPLSQATKNRVPTANARTDKVLRVLPVFLQDVAPLSYTRKARKAGLTHAQINRLSFSGRALRAAGD